MSSQGAPSREEQAVIKCESVYKIFGKNADSLLQSAKGVIDAESAMAAECIVGVNNASFEVRSGELLIVMGLSGSGKSTLLRCISRLTEATAGRILVEGEDILTMSGKQLIEVRRNKMGMVFQNFGLLPHKTVIENAAYGLELGGVKREEAHERARRQVELVGLAGFEQQYPRQLSGGMQQRVGLARALATDAEILLMDEAFSALDPLIRTDMQDQLLELQSTLHKTIVFITHDLDEALRIGDHIAILKDGELRQFGTPEEILLAPADDYVTRFVQDVNRGRVVTVGSIASQPPTIRLDQASFKLAQEKMTEAESEVVYVLDAQGHLAGVVTRELLEQAKAQADDWWRKREHYEEAPSTEVDTVIEQMLPMVDSSDIPVAVVDQDGRFVGSVSRHTAISALAKSPDELRADAEKNAATDPAHEATA